MLGYVKWTLSAVVLALASSLAFAASFEKARPVWPEASDGRPNENVRFAAAFETDGTPLTLRVTGADQYKILMDGEPIGWGPARAPKGWARVSEIPLKVAAGGHVLAFEVVGYNVVGLLSGCPQLPFLQAELVGPKGSVLAATGKGGAFRAQWISSRHRKVSRYTEQRGFIECWTVPETKGGDLALAERPGLRLTARRAPEPDLGALTIFRPIASQRVRHDPKASCRLWEYVTKTSADPKAGYPLEEQVWDAVRKSQQFVAVDRLASVKDDRVQSLSDGLRLRYDCGTNLTGFVRMKVKVTKPGKLWLNWSELLVWFRVNSFKSRLADIAVWEFTEPGEYVVETIEPYTLRYLEATSEGGQFEIESVALRRLESPEVATAKLPKMPDVELDLILSAARNTLGQNTLDTFMDCPGRERAAWLCDSYFTAKGAFAVTGNTKVEKDFLENWLLAADYGELPEGMLPMAYPSSATRETYIPNWAMWYVLELDDYLKRSGDRAFVDAMKPRLAKLLAFFRRYRNSDGLLERLPGWVFIEWSAANDYVQDVNYPANMTWAGVLEAYGRMYGDAEATAEAAKVRETVFAQSFDGRMFRDHARRWDDGTLTVMPDCSETCQNYALFFRFGNRQTPGNWYETVLRQLGGNRILNPDVMPEISRSAPFIGDTLRILALSELNEREILIRDLKAFYLDQTRRTGTLWETRRDVNSNCHGFAGVIAGVMLGLADDRPSVRTTSPDGRIAVDIIVTEDGPRWSLSCEGRSLVNPSRLGLSFQGQPAVGLVKVVSSQAAREGRWGKSEIVFEEAVMAKGLCAPRRFIVAVRVSDDGAAFRYEVPRQAAFDGFQLVNELTEWRFADNPPAWTTCFDSEKTSEEEAFDRSPLGDVPVAKLIGLPVVANVGGRTLALCEANLTNWAGLFLHRVAENPTNGQVLEARLATLPPAPAAAKDVAVIRTTPAESPWRVVLCAEDELGLIRRARMIRELNPPPEAGMDFGWVKPGVSSWDWWAESNNSLTTEKTLEFVDFAAEMGWSYHTIDGGWYGFARRPCHGPDVKVRPRPGFDLSRIVRHAADKGVGIIVWMHWMALEDNGVEETLAWLEQIGVKGVKIDFLERQDQRMVAWTEKVVRAAARHRLLVNFHGSFHPSGTERTWPNCITREAIRGNEMNLFNRQATSRHALTLPFTRFLLGPGDYTPGSFANVFARDFVPIVERGHRYGDETSREGPKTEEMGTRAQALARCIAFDSPLMTLCDWPERYRAQQGLDALRCLPTAWRRTIPVSGACGEHYAVLREAEDGSFYFAAMTVRRRTVELDLALLGEGTWMMEAYADDPERTPTDAKAVRTVRREVRRGEKVRFDLLDEGGAVAILRLNK